MANVHNEFISQGAPAQPHGPPPHTTQRLALGKSLSSQHT